MIPTGRECDETKCIWRANKAHVCDAQESQWSDCPRAIRARCEHLEATVKQFTIDLALNATMLAKQTDLAREAEIRLAEVERLGEALATKARAVLNDQLHNPLVSHDMRAALAAWSARPK